MPKMRATAKMPPGVLSRYYRTRMLTAEGNTFEEPTARWSRFYAQHGWAVVVPDEPAPEAPPRRRGRPPGRKAATAASRKSSARKSSARKPSVMTTRDSALVGGAGALEEKTVPELRDLAEEKGVDLPAGYVKEDEPVKKIEQADEDEDAGRF